MAEMFALSDDADGDSIMELIRLGEGSLERFRGQGNVDDVEKAIKCLSVAATLIPDNQPIKTPLLSNLGASYGYRFYCMGNLGNLAKAIECFSRAVSLTPEGHPVLPSRLSNLGKSYSDRFNRLGELGDLEKAIECDSRAVSLTAEGHPHFPSLLRSLGVSYTDRFRRLGELADLENAIECKSRAVSPTTEGHPDFPSLLSSLGASYGDRFNRLGELGDLENAIECKSRAVLLTAEGHPDLPSQLSNLGVSYGDRFNHLGDLGDLEKAIECDSRAVSLTPEGDPGLPSLLSNLGVSYNDRFNRLGELDDLEKSIECKSRAVSLTAEDHPDFPSRLSNLGTSYAGRFNRLGHLGDLEKAIECKSRAVTLTPEGHPRLPPLLSNLGVSYTDRFNRLGELADLERAIECKCCAVSLTTEGHPGLPSLLNKLGGSYSDRFKRLGELEDLEKAIACKSRAVSSTAEGHPHLPVRLSNLARSHSDRFYRLGELGDLEKATECISRAVSLTAEGHPDLPSLLTNLGASYASRYNCLGKLDDLTRAIEIFSRAVSLTPESHPEFPTLLRNLAVSFTYRFSLFGQLTDIEDVITYALRILELTPAGHPDSPQNQHFLAHSQILHFQHTRDPSLLHDAIQSFRHASQSVAGSPRDKYAAALEWATVASNDPTLSCIEAYQTGIDLLPQLIWLGATTHQRYQDLDQAKGLAASAASAAIQSSRFGLALEWLEHGRCVVWNQHLMLRSPLDQLRSSHPSLADRLQTVSNLLNLAGSHASRELLSDVKDPEQAAQEHRRLAEEYNQLLSAARELPGLEDFLRPMKTSSLVRAARYGPIVVINCYTDRCDALIVMPGCDHVKHIPLPRFTIEKAQRARSELGGLVRNAFAERGVVRRPVLEWDPDDSFGSLLAILWYDIVNPVLDFLGYTNNSSGEKIPHITWCPTGPLSFLPLHAAGDYDRPGLRVFDYVISSYTPTLTALLASTPSVFTPQSRVLAIGQEGTSGLNPLPGTTRELSYIRSHIETVAQCTQLVDSQATVEAVLDGMEEHDWVHLACHAHQNVADPTQSGFFLHDDGVLDLAKINQRLFRNKGLAFLSACQTAKGDKELPDEAIHLASGMLMAGYSSVIATMWSVNDEDAPLVADRVYAQLMKDKSLGNGEAGRALHNAIAELRKEVGERLFSGWVPFIHLGS